MGEVTDFLEHAGVNFDVLEHTRTVRAADEPAALRIDAEEVAKTLILIAGSGNVRAVLPASERIDLNKVAGVLGVGVKKVHLATEDDLARDYADFELGPCRPSEAARIRCSSTTAGRDSVVVEAGSHNRSVRLKAADLVRLTSAQVVDIRREAPTAF
jgi:Ala-tRNA(Pro) deacylase